VSLARLLQLLQKLRCQELLASRRLLRHLP